jgi:2-oxoglutarate ferredoxin oxidoreductase subunit delta
MNSVLVRGTVVIDIERCKGCELCIPACPPDVLVMSTATNKAGYRYPELLVGCTGCRACREICPDFVFDVFKFDTPLVVDTTASDDTDGDATLEL